MLDAVFYLVSVVDVDVAIVGIGAFASLVHFDDGVEELVYASAVLEDGRNHRYSEEFAQLVVVDVVASFLGLVEHIESAHHADVHIDELSGEIEVALQVAGVDDVDDDIGCVLDELLAHIELLGRVG